MASASTWWPLGGASPSNLTYSPLVESILPNRIRFPIYHVHRDDIIPGISDTVLSLLAPVIAYWLVSGVFHLMDVLDLPFFEQYRIHEPEEVKKRNRATPIEVVKAVVLQQVLQTGLGFIYLAAMGEEKMGDTDYREEMRPYAQVLARATVMLMGPKRATQVLARTGQQLVQWLYWWGVPALQLFWACFVMDTWQYFWHRGFHVNKFLYRNIHSVHHRLYVPYAYGALYNHPIEGLIFDSGGGVFSHAMSFMTVRQAILLFTVSTAKTVDDHCGFKLPWDPFQFLFINNVDYHDIHHQQFGIKKNFAQPYFTNWDVLLGTHMSREQAEEFRLRKRKGGGASSNGTATPVSSAAEDKAMTTANGIVPHTDGRDPLVKKRRGVGADGDEL